GTPSSELFIENRVDELAAMASPDAALDYIRWANPWGWGADQSFAYAIGVLKNEYLAVRRTHLFITHNVDHKSGYSIPNSFSAELPNAQPADATIEIRSCDYNPDSHNQDQEYIELYNPNAYSIDISGWRLRDAVEHEFLPGTVIVPDQSLYVCPDSAAFRARTSGPKGGQGLFVQGGYKGHLSSWGETITLLNRGNNVVDTWAYTGSPSLQQRYLRITELMYHPTQGGEYNEEEYEYVELMNIGEAPLLLDEVRFTGGIYYEFPPGENRYLQPGGCLLIVKNRDAFAERYDADDIEIAPGFYTGSLSNAGEEINLEDVTNSTILSFDYDDDWFALTDGLGYSLTGTDPNNPDLDAWDSKKGWRASAYIGGTPGYDDSGIIPNPGSVVINEILAHSHGVEPDWIELHNTTDSQIDIGGWYLSDSQFFLKKYRFADGTTIDAHDYFVLTQDANFGEFSTDPGRITGFAFSENGEQAYLTSAEGEVLTGYREIEDFGASYTGVSFGRYYKRSTDSYNFVPMDHNTPDAANSYPAVGPVVISEIMYNPVWPGRGVNENDYYEYVELHNITDRPVKLYRDDKSLPWKFSDGIEFTFPDAPDEVTIPAYDYIVVVKDVNAFRGRYSSVPADKIYGPYDGQLENAGERLEISMPGDIDMFGRQYYIRIDRVRYSDGSHDEDAPWGIDLWPVEADGDGASLTRISPGLYGNDPNNWTAQSPGPGEP
ncbi:MAG: lamin tail domain-containing protein, partial [Planctomycetota bacterium]